jgi:predicted DNA binding CopG/RHH family protein
MKAKPNIERFTDNEERSLIKSLEANDAVFKSHLTPARKKQIEAMARATMNDEREKITLRISRSDLSRIKSKAMQEGMPYQTLINSILHKAVS